MLWCVVVCCAVPCFVVLCCSVLCWLGVYCILLFVLTRFSAQGLSPPGGGVCMLPSNKVTELRCFVQLLKDDPALLHSPELDFFREFMLSFGASLPVAAEAPTTLVDDSSASKGGSSASPTAVPIDAPTTAQEGAEHVAGPQEAAAVPPVDTCAAGPNFEPSAQPGCHIVTPESKWIIGMDDFDEEELGLEPGHDPPDISVDPETQMLSVINASGVTRSYFVTAGHKAVDRDGRALSMGTTRDAKGTVTECITFVVVAAPRQVVDLCYLKLSRQAMKRRRVDVASDIKDVRPHPDPDGFDPARTYAFPLGGPGPFLCTQGAGGQFTHFYPGTLHAVDFACPVGTPVLAVGAGTVTAVRQVCGRPCRTRSGSAHAVARSRQVRLDQKGSEGAECYGVGHGTQLSATESRGCKCCW